MLHYVQNKSKQDRQALLNAKYILSADSRSVMQTKIHQISIKS